jgi:hypothetical protein
MWLAKGVISTYSTYCQPTSHLIRVGRDFSLAVEMTCDVLFFIPPIRVYKKLQNICLIRHCLLLNLTNLAANGLDLPVIVVVGDDEFFGAE